MREFLIKPRRELSDTRGPITAALVLLMHILWVNIKEKKTHPTCSDSQRHFATRKIKVECGKAWGLCALGQERVRWAHIYSKARTAWGFHWPQQHWGCRPDPKTSPSTSNSPPLYLAGKLELTLYIRAFLSFKLRMCTWPPFPLSSTQTLLAPLYWAVKTYFWNQFLIESFTYSTKNKRQIFFFLTYLFLVLY